MTELLENHTVSQMSFVSRIHCACEAYRVGGVADHVHIAARLARTISQSELLEKIKKTSSAWIKTQGRDYASFFWQAGYGAFSMRHENANPIR